MRCLPFYKRDSPVVGRSQINLRAAYVLVGCSIFCGHAHAQSAAQLLSQAETLSDAGERYRARPLFRKAEEEFQLSGDKRDQLYAKFGRLRVESDQGNYQAIKAQVQHDLTDSVVQNDPELKIQALSLIGIIDMNIDTAAAAADWKEVLQTATATGDLKWQNRARGDLAGC